MKRPQLKLASILDKLIKERGITYRSLARKTGVSTSTIFNWTAGAKPGNISDLQVVANFLEVELSYLLFGISAPDSKYSKISSKNRVKGIFEIVFDEQGAYFEKLKSLES